MPKRQHHGEIEHLAQERSAVRSAVRRFLLTGLVVLLVVAIPVGFLIRAVAEQIALDHVEGITQRLADIKAMVDEGDYFCINRGRQYGKTTTLRALTHYLQDCYTVIPLDFQRIDSERKQHVLC